jgi:hypothetical protein
MNILVGVLSALHHVCTIPEQRKVARGTQVSIGTFAKQKYLSHCLGQLNGSSLVKCGKPILGLAIARLN